MQENNAMDFYENIVKGTDYGKTITLEHAKGYELEDVEMSPVSKTVLASVIERLPEEMFDAAEDFDPDEVNNPEEAMEEQEIEMSAITEETVEAFEDLVAESLSHPELTKPQMDDIARNLSFEPLFELGAEIIEISFEQTGVVKDFHEQA